MNKAKRLEAIKAMVLIASLCTDKEAQEYWAANGIAAPADGTPEDEWYDFYTYDEHFEDAVRGFLGTMALAARTGGLECDGISVKAKKPYTPAQIEIISEEIVSHEKEGTQLDTAQKVDFSEDVIHNAEKSRREAEENVKVYMQCSVTVDIYADGDVVCNGELIGKICL